MGRTAVDGDATVLDPGFERTPRPVAAIGQHLLQFFRFFEKGGFLNGGFLNGGFPNAGLPGG